MIDHVSIGVTNLAAGRRFYQAALAPLGLSALHEAETAIGFGKRYPEFWLNRCDDSRDIDLATHVCLRGPSEAAVRAFYDAGLTAGGTDDGPPGLRPQYTENYFAAFLIDPFGNRIEAVCFLSSDAED